MHTYLPVPPFLYSSWYYLMQLLGTIICPFICSVTLSLSSLYIRIVGLNCPNPPPPSLFSVFRFFSFFIFCFDSSCICHLFFHPCLPLLLVLFFCFSISQHFSCFPFFLSFIYVFCVFLSAISAISRSGRWKEALSIMKQMREDGLNFDEFTYSAAISACGKAGNAKKAVQLLNEMVKDHGKPACIPRKGGLAGLFA